jgi:acyl carrier protein
MAELVRLKAVPASVEVVCLAGEALGRQLVEQIYEQETIEEVWNLYGPSEDTTYSTFVKVERDAERVSIGRPIGNTEVYVLDRQMRVVPVGVVGELYIGGDGLARGYLRRGGLTAERFVPHPYSRRGGARLYRSGDLVRYLEGGEIEFVGRRDEQVKVRGYRIELGEIEAVLAGYDAVREVAVVAREDAQGGKVLGAYVVAKQESMLSVSELRRYLKKKLPDYMIPTAFLMLDEMPLNANGKVDRRALLATNTTRPVLEGAIVAPRTPVEEKMAAIWAEVLGIEEVGVYNNFFELGGHSLLVMQVASRVGDIFGTELPLHCFFESPTIAEQAVAIVQQQAEHTDHEILAQTLAEIDQLSEDEAQNMLADK